MDLMQRSFIDDNGNPCDEEGEENKEVEEVLLRADQIMQAQGQNGAPESPKYFINAAELSEEDAFFDDVTEDRKAEDKEKDCENSKKRAESNGISGNSNSKKVFRSRVPISKSYPDIVQTTLSNKKEDMEEEKAVVKCQDAETGQDPIKLNPMKKENSDLESLKDSLENLAVAAPEKKEENEAEKPLEPQDATTPKAFQKPVSGPSSTGIGILSASALLTESQMSGLFAEKPPEAWEIDFNSLSIDSELDLNMSASSYNKRRGSNSNSNSLSFFVKMDEKSEEEEKSESLSTSTTSEKKIFSMFVDLGEAKKSKIPNLKKQQIQPQSSQPSSSSNTNVMESSTGSLKLRSKSGSGSQKSPKFQHKAAAEAARRAARLEWEKQKEKYFDSLEPSSMMMMSMMGQREFDKDSCSHTMGESSVSNRSSLHVANVLDSYSSSIISSMDASHQGEMETCQGGPCLKLGLDLLRMFQEGINTDVIISVNGRYIRAHKCILASRSQYFAAILSGHWVEKAGNTINLDGFSYSVVQFTLYHIYSGTNEIPETIDLLELATLTDLLGLEGLRENVSQTFKTKFCHNFHRPCTGCITGVLECFPIATSCGMDELHRKMIKWISKHFVRIWPTKGFASLEKEMIDKCLQYSINHLSVDNILDHTLGCDQLSTTMPTLRWTEPIFNMVSQLAEECVQFLGENMSDVLQSQKFLQFGKGQAWNISRIEGTFMHAMSLLKPDSACLSHTALSRLIELGTETIDEVEWSTSFVDFLKSLQGEVEKYLMANASKAVLSRCWEELDPSFRKKLCSSSFVGFDKYGNKIIKNTGPPVGTGGGHGHGVNKAEPKPRIQRDRNRESGRSSKTGQGHTQPSSAKVASVRPMPHPRSQAQQAEHENVSIAIPTHPQQEHSHPPQYPSRGKPQPQPRTLASQGRSGTMSSTDSNSTTVRDTPSSSNRPTPTTSRLGNRTLSGLEREKLLSRRASATTASPTHSASRTPIKPLTPSVPPKSSPLLGHSHGASTRGASATATAMVKGRASSATTGSRAQSAVQRRLNSAASNPPPEPPKKTFLSNSAKAAAVSKPILKPKRTPSTSSNQSGQSQSPTPCQSAQGSKPSSGGIGGRPQGFRYSAAASVSAQPHPPTTAAAPRRAEVKSKVDCNAPVRRNTIGNANAGQSSTRPTASRPNSSTAQQQKSKVSSSSTVSRPGTGRGQGRGRQAVQTPSANVPDFESFSESFQPDSLMSRSTIERESGEVKMRTLAEIGRSSTFSKDEPTILGKMEMNGSGYCVGQEEERDHGDYEDDFYDDEDDEDYD